MTHDEHMAALDAVLLAVEKSMAAHEKSLAAMKLLDADNVRLRALVKGIEASLNGRCPWCGAMRSDVHATEPEPHSAQWDVVPHPDLTHADCPAFTPDGAVR